MTRATNGNDRRGYSPTMARRRDIDRLSELEELFADLWQVPRFASGLRHAHKPQLDVVRTQDPPGVCIVVELPGADPDKIHVVLEGRSLRIFGDRPRPRYDGAVWYRSEIEYGRFERELTLAVEVDPGRARASYDGGLLTVVLPIAERPPRSAPVPIDVERHP